MSQRAEHAGDQAGRKHTHDRSDYRAERFRRPAADKVHPDDRDEHHHEHGGPKGRRTAVDHRQVQEEYAGERECQAERRERPRATARHAEQNEEQPDERPEHDPAVVVVDRRDQGAVLPLVHQDDHLQAWRAERAGVVGIRARRLGLLACVLARRNCEKHFLVALHLARIAQAHIARDDLVNRRFLELASPRRTQRNAIDSRIEPHKESREGDEQDGEHGDSDAGATRGARSRQLLQAIGFHGLTPLHLATSVQPYRERRARAGRAQTLEEDFSYALR